MNKSDFIKELSNKTGYDEGKCIEINSIVENTLLVGKENKEKMITEMKEKLNFGDEEANKVYETVAQIIAKAIKDKLRHPFGGNK